MSLLLLNASNRIAQGFLRVAVESGKYERIVCADIFPTYPTINRLLRFRDSLNTTTKIDLFKINDKQDLHDAIKQCNNLLYVTHDYYQLVASKKNLLVATINLVKTRNYKYPSHPHSSQAPWPMWRPSSTITSRRSMSGSTSRSRASASSLSSPKSGATSLLAPTPRSPTTWLAEFTLARASTSGLKGPPRRPSSLETWRRL